SRSARRACLGASPLRRRFWASTPIWCSASCSASVSSSSPSCTKRASSHEHEAEVGDRDWMLAPGGRVSEGRRGRSGAAVPSPSYASSGVDTVNIETGLGRLLGRINATFAYPRRGHPVLPNGFFANVLDLGGGQGLAITTDGVGT